MQRSFFFFFGVVIGILFGFIPVLAENTLDITLCRESCPGWFMGSSIFVYLAMPVAWGLLLAFTIGKPSGAIHKRTIAIAILASALLMSAITFFSYAHQARML